jgi:hypothetical protein
MRVGLFVSCYVDAFHPDVGIVTLELLERFGIEVEYPFDQACGGQPMTNSGCHAESAATEVLFVRNFAKFAVPKRPRRPTPRSWSTVHTPETSQRRRRELSVAQTKNASRSTF